MRFRIHFPDQGELNVCTHIVVPLNLLTGTPFLTLAVYFRQDGTTFTRKELDIERKFAAAKFERRQRMTLYYLSPVNTKLAE